MKTAALLLLAALQFGPAVLAVPETPPAIAVSIHPHEAPVSVLAAVWTDGTIVWSEDKEDGGPPFLTAKIDPTKTKDFLAKLEKEGVFKKSTDFHIEYGPDASYHEINLLNGKRYVCLGSWHELFERNPKVVANSHGLSSLGDRTREQVLKEDTQSYRDFRKLWKEVRDFAATLIPEKGEPYKGALKFEYPTE